MRLKTIKLAGFKSFVDPTTVHMPSNLCGVVGPNGCGKSNIIDAVRWVLGEASAKHLRGESMTDVIFNGSTGRKPVGQASIELIFDNSDGTLGGEYSTFTEIAVRRMVSRDGQSAYFLNGARCRRRDITDIFLGTGLGPRSYAIIEQGMISRLIEAKPEDLRVYIEEAAGISKYKERRKDTESRIRRTRENLERLTDLRDELERQLERLKRQAAAAERYTELKAEERQVRAELLALQWMQLDRQGAESRDKIRGLEVSIEEVLSRQTHVDAGIETARAQHSDLNEALAKVQERYYAIGAEIARTEQSVQHQQERARQFQADLQQTRRSIEESARHLADDQRRRDEMTAELDSVMPALSAAESSEAQASEALAVAEAAMSEWQHQWDSFTQQAEKPRQDVEVQQARIRQFERSLEEAEQRLEQLRKEASELSASGAETEQEQLEERLAQLEEQTHILQEQVDGAREQIEAHRQLAQQVSAELDEVKMRLQENRGRLASLRALQQAALGQTDDSVKGWLTQNGLQSNARLAEKLTVEPGWETAVETVLGSHLQAVCVDEIATVGQSLGGLDAGTMTLFAPNPNAQRSTAAGLLLDKVSADFDVSDLLGRIRAVDSLSDALAIQSSLDAGESVVTRDGIWLGRDWLRVVKDADAQAGVIQRNREINELEELVDVLGEKESELAEQLEQSRDAAREAEAQMQSVQQELRGANARFTETMASLSACRARLEQIALRRDRNRLEQEQFTERHELQREELGEARRRLEQAIDAMHMDSVKREELQTRREQIRSSLEGTRQQAREDKDAAHRLAMQRQSLSTRIEALVQSIERVTDQAEQLREREVLLEQQLAESELPIAEGRERLEEQLQQRLEVEERLTDARQRVQAVEHGLRESERQRNQIQQELDGVRSQLEKARIDGQAIEVRTSNLLDQLREAGFELQAVLDAIDPEANEDLWQQRLDKLGNQIQRLGPINLAAVDEYKSQSERKNYLDAQNNDLVSALETLENAIRKIDRETRTRFKDTFDKVNVGLQELFPRVFGGGHAYLELTGEDLLDTGVAIMARPPGKRNATIHLLSGGEKALTALSLVFSIFRLNPSPFCMLDEVDAPLDDANVGRFARMVREMSEKVQFIVITHNKITMEMAHHLMGVTMHEPGVSRLVSVDVDEAVALADIA